MVKGYASILSSKRRKQMTYVLGIDENDQVVINCGVGNNDDYRVITSEEDFQEFLFDEAKRLGVTFFELNIMCSSSMDFPEDHTSNPETIALARALR
jgi:hypothetical protein